MERLKTLIGKRENRIEFVRDLVDLLLTGEFYSDEVLFRDAVEEIYSILRSEVVENCRRDLTDAYETALLLRTSISGRTEGVGDLLRELRRNLKRAGS